MRNGMACLLTKLVVYCNQISGTIRGRERRGLVVRPGGGRRMCDAACGEIEN